MPPGPPGFYKNINKCLKSQNPKSLRFQYFPYILNSRCTAPAADIKPVFTVFTMETTLGFGCGCWPISADRRRSPALCNEIIWNLDNRGMIFQIVWGIYLKHIQRCIKKHVRTYSRYLGNIYIYIYIYNIYIYIYIYIYWGYRIGEISGRIPWYIKNYVFYKEPLYLVQTCFVFCTRWRPPWPSLAPMACWRPARAMHPCYLPIGMWYFKGLCLDSGDFVLLRDFVVFLINYCKT